MELKKRMGGKNIKKEAVKHYRRHWFLFKLLRTLVSPALKYIFAFHCKKEKALKRPSLIIANHYMDLDPALMLLDFSDCIYFVASEHIFRLGFPTQLLKFVFSPIPINKAQSDPSALREIFSRLKAGFSVGIFAEGNRSFNGLTGDDIPFSTAKLVKMSGADMITYRIEGAYFASPRWSKKLRRGKVTGAVTGRYSAEELQSMTHEEIFTLIQRGISGDSYRWQKENQIPFKGKDIAEHIETALYLCPKCKKLGTIHSQGSRFFCGCGLDAAYTETGFIEGAPFTTVTDWDKWQTEELAEIVNNSGDEPICVDENQRLFLVWAAMKDTLIGEGPMSISRNEFCCAGMTFPLQQIRQFACLGKMTLIFSLKDGTQYEVKSVAPRSALKYLQIYRILQNE
jgi:hypothetical protein